MPELQQAGYRRPNAMPHLRRGPPAVPQAQRRQAERLDDTSARLIADALYGRVPTPLTRREPPNTHPVDNDSASSVRAIQIRRTRLGANLTRGQQTTKTPLPKAITRDILIGTIDLERH